MHELTLLQNITEGIPQAIICNVAAHDDSNQASASQINLTSVIDRVL